jgi:glycosyltransferase involved in cell wall biosynthesis
MRILVINWQDRTHPQSGGAEVHLHEIFGRIARMGHDVHLLCCGHGTAPAYEVLDDLHVYRVGHRPTFNYSVPRWWKQYGAGMKLDIVIDDINKIPFFTPLYIRQPLLAIVHHFFGSAIFNEAGWLAGTYVKMFEDRIGRVYRSTPIVAVSESTRQECLERGFGASSVSVIHNAIDHRSYPMRVGTKSTSPSVVYFGRLKKYKSVDHVIKAMALVRETIPDAHLHILGTGDERTELERLVDFHDLQDAVTFHGYVTDAQKVAHLSAAHVAVNSSVKEGWGITNIEANACGTPVISANVPGLRDSVRDGLSGLLYPYGNIEQLAQLMTRVLVDHPERTRLSEGAVAWASTFTWERSAREMLDRCENTIQSWKQTHG